MWESNNADLLKRKNYSSIHWILWQEMCRFFLTSISSLTPAGCPTIKLNSDTTYQELTSYLTD